MRESTPRAVPCVVCREEIQPEAQFCVHCQRYQDWRRFFGISATILSLLTALFAVLGATVPVIVTSLTPGVSDVRCSLLDLNLSANEAKLIVFNRGIRPAVVKTLKLEPKDGTLEDLVPEDASLLLEPGKMQILTFKAVTHVLQWENIRSRSKLYLIIFPFAHESALIPCDNWSGE
jgi:hypothetical protein